MRKRTLSLLLASALSLSLALPALAAESDTPPRHYPVLTESEITYVPLRAIAEDLGFSVEWNQATQTATVSNSVYSIQIQPLRRTTSVSYVEGAVSAAMTMKDDRMWTSPSSSSTWMPTSPWTAPLPPRRPVPWLPPATPSVPMTTM